MIAQKHDKGTAVLLPQYVVREKMLNFYLFQLGHLMVDLET